MTTAILEVAPNTSIHTPSHSAVWTPFNAHDEGQRLLKEWYTSLEHANERKEPVANVFVMGNAIEILRSFDFHMVFPEINSLQTGVRKTSAEFIRISEDYGMSPDVCSYVKADVGMMLKDEEHPVGKMPKPDLSVSSNMCGTFIKWAEIWERRYKMPSFVLDLPGQRTSNWMVRPGDAQHSADSRWVEDLCVERGRRQRQHPHGPGQ